MALIKCTDCNWEISTQARVCPNCGTTLSREEDLSALVWVVIIAIGLLAFAGLSLLGII